MHKRRGAVVGASIESILCPLLYPWSPCAASTSTRRSRSSPWRALEREGRPDHGDDDARSPTAPPRLRLT